MSAPAMFTQVLRHLLNENMKVVQYDQYKGKLVLEAAMVTMVALYTIEKNQKYAPFFVDALC